MWTGLKENSEYSAQITPYHGHVNAEIIRRDKDKGFYDYKIDCWLTVMDKSFGRTFASSPRQKDWDAAKRWVEEQLKMIEENATVMVTMPQFLKTERHGA